MDGEIKFAESGGQVTSEVPNYPVQMEVSNQNGHFGNPGVQNPQTSNGINMNAEQAGGGAMHFFLYLVTFLSLSFVATGVGSILFQLINKYVTDELSKNGYAYFSSFGEYVVKYGIASILVATPVYFILTWLITKYLREGKIKETSKVRKWLSYIILFFAAATMLGDLITIIYNYLGGDMASRLLLKVLVVLLIAGAIFGYYFWDLHKNNMVGKTYVGNKIAFIASLIVIIATFLLAFAVVDSPTTTKNKKIDGQTVSDLRSAQSAVESYVRKNGALPQKIEDVSEFVYGDDFIESKKVIYLSKDKTNYQLCANFKRSDKNDKDDSIYSYGSYDDKWKHDSGKVCFERDVSDEQFDRYDSSDSQVNQRVQAMQNQNYDPLIGGNDYGSVQTQSTSNSVASLKSRMASATPYIVMCRDDDGTVLSGKSGQLLCSNNQAYVWPSDSAIPDLQWVVLNGNSDAWDYTVTSSIFPVCNGPQNAKCSADGCVFAPNGTCK